MIEDESEVFEITDFTTASEWERFIAKLEEIIHEWKLSHLIAGPLLTKDELTTGTWEEKTTNVQFADFSFTVTRHSLRQSSPDPNQSSASLSSSDPVKPSAVSDEDDQTSIPFIWQDMMSVENSFPSRAHCLCRWYGLRDFIVVATAPGMNDIMSESRVNMLISSISVAANNTGCQVPFFVQFHSKWRRLFAGISEYPGFRTSFEMVQLKNTPQQCANLTSLLNVFKSKISAPVSSFPTTAVAVRMTYILQDWTQYAWPQPPPDFDSATGEIGVTEFGVLPFGAYEDPVCELHLSTTWPGLAEHQIVEDSSFSDLDPIFAPHWSVRVRVADNPQCLLGDFLNGFVKFCSRTESTQQLLGKSIILSDSADLDVSQALQRLTDPGPYVLPSIGKAVKRATSKLALRPEDAPIPLDLLNEILLFLFPDAREASVKTKGLVMTSSGSSTISNSEVTDGVMSSSTSEQDLQSNEILGCQFKEMFRQLKSAPLGSLTSRLAICMCIINHSHGGLCAVAHLWQEFVLEMRYRWENNYVIPDLEPGNPNMGCCLLHQKLQMLNCCIERKKAREALSGDSKSPSGDGSSVSSVVGDNKNSPNKDVSLSSDEEFYECPEEDASIDGTEGITASMPADEIAVGVVPSGTTENDDAALSSSLASSVGQSSSVTDSALFAEPLAYQPEGRLHQHEDLMLLNVSEPLYVPVTQEPSPMTEDLLEEHAEVLAKLGTSPEGAHLRARMQSACLLSDMEAFKAANPGCVLGDFVRWYSPRDWVEEKMTDAEGNVTFVGQLSQRMQIPGNMWLEVWQSARPIPARRQRRLFDDTKEAEKVLHWLTSMKPADVAIRLMPMLVHAAINKLMEKDKCRLPLLQKMMTQIINKGTKATRSISNEAKRYEDLIRHISLAEIFVTRAQLLLVKLQQEKNDLDIKTSDLEQFVSDLLEHPEVNIDGGSKSSLGTIIHRLFTTSCKTEVVDASNEDDSSSSAERLQFRSEFPRPVGKEYILRTMVSRPAPWSRPSPQRMYCVLMKDDFRLAGAFTSDTTFQ